MSLYNALFGQNPLSDVFLATLGLAKGDFGRFRDCFIADGEIAVYTRNGGGNRQHWENENPEGEICDCPGCIITYRMPKHPYYLRDKDDDFDSTYATIYFKFPDEYAELLKAFDTGEFKPEQKWLDKLSEVQKPGYEPPPAIQKLKESLEKAIRGEGPKIIEV